jgi:hypothetical protein
MAAFHGGAIFLVAATGISKLLIDDGDRQPIGVIDLDRVRQLWQLALGRREGAVLFEFHLGCMIAMPLAWRSASRL